ncbi:hypothetical protein PM082_016693 [Marasmius tenuissimus]|nr:hypothetical protein PM082_016693 [Marasmius tenuissimus]
MHIVKNPSLTPSFTWVSSRLLSMRQITAALAASQNLDDTIGAYLIGLVASSILYGIICNQGWTYFFTYHDRLFLRGTVITLLILVTIHAAFHTHASYIILVTNFSRIIELDRVWSLVVRQDSFDRLNIELTEPKRIKVTVPLEGVIVVICQVFYVIQVYHLGRKMWIVAIIIGLTIIQIGFSLGLCCPWRRRFQGTSCAPSHYVITCELIGPAFIGEETVIQMTDTLIQRLMIYAVSTGALVGAGVVTILLTMVLQPDSYVFVALFEVYGNLYVLSLLARLNSRVPPRPGGNINLVTESHYLSSLRVEEGPQDTVQTADSVTSVRPRSPNPNSKNNQDSGKS